MFEVVCGIVTLAALAVMATLCWKLLSANQELQAGHARDLTRLVMASTTASVARADPDSARILTDRFAQAQAQTQFPETLGQLVMGQKELRKAAMDDVESYQAEGNWTARLLGELDTGRPLTMGTTSNE